ncbi:uncharacterized protein LOC108627661 [Ceratina calcarata]|uniref:Uncharacterized protein LOC108627661 n=1 Tax=Ceratina calcarata TaxID=156304 RepID=A0AAJ7S557_9HYME|nr:uncharacterized protein LOC108627661 [Ceratina calcarata]XP_017884488.1 uncharacterized protein LOC108627661 [Ceratina calcarata]XP_026671579.1 uncharacterized protein LOC108627661 [Ceratina calcarata]XP_026671580.1 uncharacterized protein LOC108627661 [Ceratina calcarata]
MSQSCTIMKSHEIWKRSIEFIEQELLPEMVHERCFCEKNSREFVEFDSAIIRLDELSRTSEIYRVTAVVRFSGEPRSFPLLIKLLPEEGAENRGPIAFDSYQNEEMFYSKMTAKYGTDLVPKCYLSDLGRYGRPVIVLEDLEEDGYKQVDEELNEEHLKLCVKVLAKFHARGLRLKENEPQVFREFEAKLLEVCLNEDMLQRYQKKSTRMTDILEFLPNRDLAEKIKSKLNKNPLEIARTIATEVNDASTICHGYFSHDNLLFKYRDGKPIDAKIIDWQTMRYCSPAVDLGPILLFNVTQEHGSNASSKVHEILALYIDTVAAEYPEIERDCLRQDIEDKFLFACIVLSFLDHISDEELIRVLLLLEHL